MANQREPIGEGECLCCARSAPVKEQANGHLLMKCDFCGLSVQCFLPKSSAFVRARAKLFEVAPVEVAKVDPVPVAKDAKVESRPAYLRG